MKTNNNLLLPTKPEPRDFQSPEFVRFLQTATTARIGVSRTGERPRTQDALNFRRDHAAARDAVWSQVPEEWVQRYGCLSIASEVQSKEEYLLRPDRGRKARQDDIPRLRQSGLLHQTVLLLIGDGLSANALEANLEDLLPSLRVGLEKHGLTASPPIFIRYARVGIMDHIGEILQPETVILLIGERPGLLTSESLSAYLCWRPRLSTVESDRDVISNIHREGFSILEAGAVIADQIQQYLEYQSSGIQLRKRRSAVEDKKPSKKADQKG